MDFWRILNEPFHDISCFYLNTNNIGADQPAHLRRLICIFAVRLPDRNEDSYNIEIIFNFLSYLCAEQTGLSIALSQTSELVMMWPILIHLGITLVKNIIMSSSNIDHIF